MLRSGSLVLRRCGSLRKGGGLSSLRGWRGQTNRILNVVLDDDDAWAIDALPALRRKSAGWVTAAPLGGSVCAFDFGQMRSAHLSPVECRGAHLQNV